MSKEKDKTNIRSEIKSDGLKELLRRADEDAANKVEASHSGDELINLADNIHALTEDFSEDLASAAVIEGQIFDTTTSGSYEEGDIQVLEGLEAVRLRPSWIAYGATLSVERQRLRSVPAILCQFTIGVVL
jgi:hypothetical protein